MSLTLGSLLDSRYYLALYPDVVEAIASGFVKDEVEHFTQYGASQNRIPGPLFDSNYYLSQYPDVAEAIASGFVTSAAEHFTLYGAQQNRLASSLFDPNYYLSLYPDVAEAIASGFVDSPHEHFLRYGQSENRIPSRSFNPVYYLTRYSDVAEAIATGFVTSAFQHFTLYGQVENRLGNSPPPIAAGDIVTTDEDTPISISPLLNDVDTDGDALAIVGVAQPANGAVTIESNGTLSYVPNANFNGSDDLTYIVADQYGSTTAATVSVTVNPLPDPPIAANDVITVNEDTPFTFSQEQLFANDTEPDGGTLFISGFTQPENGLLEGNGDGTYTYIPTANFNGSTSFLYTIADGVDGSTTATVTIAVLPINDAPIATNDTLTTNEDSPLTINIASLLANDSDIEDGTVSLLSVSLPTNGSLVTQGEDSYVYIPNPDFNGNDALTYTVIDRDGASATATVNLAIASVNDLPFAGNDSFTLGEDTSFSLAIVNLLANDGDIEDGGTLTITNVTQPSNGSLVADANGAYTYIPNANFSGTNDFIYTVSDRDGATASAVVTLTVTAVNDLPIATNDAFTINEDETLQFNTADLLANDREDDEELLLLTNFTPTANGQLRDAGNGTFTYRPDPNSSGVETFIYTITDGTSNASTATATVTITINAVNDAPLVGNDAVTANEDTPLLINGAELIANDVDAEGEPLTIIGFTQTSNGSLMGFGNGAYLYMPNPDFSGEDDFTYTVRDGLGATANANVSITVLRDLNVPPLAVDDFVSTNEDSAIAINVLANDSDAETSALTIVDFTTPTQGSITLGEDNVFTYTPIANFTGSDKFTYTIRDGNNATAIATVNIDVTAVNDAPVLLNPQPQRLRSLKLNDPDNVGNQVFDVVVGRVSDPDEDAVAGIAVIAADDQNGQWKYSIDNGNNWRDFGSVSETSALLLAGKEMLLFAPTPGFQGVTTLTFRAWDQTAGVNGETMDLTKSGTGGSTALSSSTDTSVITIGSVPLDLTGFAV